MAWVLAWLLSVLGAGAQTRTVSVNTNGGLLAPSNFWTANFIGDGVTVILTNTGTSWSVILKSAADAGGTNARIANLAGVGTNTTLQGLVVNTNLLLQTATASRVAIFDASKQLTNSAAVDTTELEFLDGVSSAIQTQFASTTNNTATASNNLYATETTRNGAVSNAVITETITSSNNLRTIIVNAETNKVENKAGSATNLTAQGLVVNTNLLLQTATASRVAIFDASKQLTNSAAVDTTELEFLDGVSSAIQTQFTSTTNNTATASNNLRTIIVNGLTNKMENLNGNGTNTTLYGSRAMYETGTTNAALRVNNSNGVAILFVATNGTVGINTTNPTAILEIGGGNTAFNSAVNAVAATNDFFQYNIQNTSAGASAESGYSATADNGTATSGFSWLGINSSAFSLVANYAVGGANDTTLIGKGNDMYLAQANTNKDMVFSMGIAASPFWKTRAVIKSTTSGGALGVTAGLSTSNAWVGGKIIEVQDLAFTNNSTLLAVTNAYTNATLIAANMLTNKGDSIICEWDVAHRTATTSTNAYHVVYGSQIIMMSGQTTFSNGVATIKQRITRGASGTVQNCVGGILPSVVISTTFTNAFTASQSNWIDTAIGLRFGSSGAQAITNIAFRMYYEPATR